MSKEYIITCESTADLTAASAVEQSIFYISRSYGMKHPGPDKCVVYHCDNKGGAERLQNTVELCFPHLSGTIPILPMGAVVSCCCGREM